MSAVAQVQEELEKAASLVTTARRLLATGTTMVDLSALEGKVRHVCTSLAGMKREDGQPLKPAMEKLIADLDRLDEAIRERYQPLVDRLGPPDPG